MQKILVTGGAGYIGSHTVNKLINQNFEVVVYDNLTTGFRQAVSAQAKFVQGDIRDEKLLTDVMASENITGVIHFAAKLNVKESTLKPQEYFENNVTGTISVVNAMRSAGVPLIVFSSTGSLYGDSVSDRAILEEDPKSPLNPYAFSKLKAEEVLQQAAAAGQLRFKALRYFNAAGASDDGLNGQRTADPYHLIHLAVLTALGRRSEMQIHGADYATPDRTCIRDYIHVEDLADIHVLALQHLLAGGDSDIFNCGYGQGYSVRQVIDMVKKVANVDFPVIESERRPGDAISLVADSSKLKKLLGWQPKRADLELICRAAYEWEKRFS